MNEDIRIIICQNEADANAEKTKWETALGASVEIVVREVKALPIMNPVTCGPKPVIFSLQVSDASQTSTWVITIQKK